MARVLQTPSVETPVLALLSSSKIPGEPEEGLQPEDKRSEQSLKEAHQGNAWAIRSATTASLFNRVMLLWLRQLQEKVPASDIRIQQDINKIVAAVQFSADATLNSAQFAAKAMASSITARQLLLLRQWQADACHKWHLASAPFTEDKLFGETLEFILIETRDKRKVLSSSQLRDNYRFSSFYRHQPFRGLI